MYDYPFFVKICTGKDLEVPTGFSAGWVHLDADKKRRPPATVPATA